MGMTTDREKFTEFGAADGGCIVNFGRDIVLISTPSLIELKELWVEFDNEIRGHLCTLLKMRSEDVVRQFGRSKLQDRTENKRKDQLFGFVTRNDIPKLIQLQTSAVVAALVEIGRLPPLTVKGLLRKSSVHGEGPVSHTVDALGVDEQYALIDHLIAGDLDTLLRFNPACILGWGGFSKRIDDCLDAVTFLNDLADEVDRFAYETSALGTKNRHGSGYIYSPVWFAVFLAKKGVWLLPQDYLPVILNFFPIRLRPILGFLAIPAHSRDIAELSFALAKDIGKTSIKQAFQVLLIASLSSDMLSSRRFCPFPLIILKQFNNMETNSGILSSSINHVYRFLIKVFQINADTRPESPLFYMQKRPHSELMRPFGWCYRPNSKNTKKLRSILQRDVAIVPDYMTVWAEALTNILPMFQVETMRNVITDLNLWLFYLMTLNPERVPMSLQDVDRRKHVNDNNDHDQTFTNFLKKHFSVSKRSAAQRAVSAIAKAWKLASLDEGFGNRLTNPFDANLDPPPQQKKGKAARTSRKPLLEIVADYLAAESLRDDFAFARSQERYWVTLMPLALANTKEFSGLRSQSCCTWYSLRGAGAKTVDGWTAVRETKII